MSNALCKPQFLIEDPKDALLREFLKQIEDLKKQLENEENEGFVVMLLSNRQNLNHHVHQREYFILI